MRNRGELLLALITSEAWPQPDNHQEIRFRILITLEKREDWNDRIM